MGGRSEGYQLMGEDNRPQDISFYTFEAAVAREERHIRRLIIALVIAIIGIVVSNGTWLYCWMQYDYTGIDDSVETTVTLDGSTGGNANYIGQRGMIINGEGDSYNPETDTDTYKD